VIVYVQTGDDSLRSLRVMGEQCPVDGGGAAVTWIGSVDETAGMDWLEAMARADDGESFGSSALNALAIHQSTDAGLRLYRLAKEPAESLAEEAIFWLAQNDTSGAVELLQDIALADTDPQQRGDALFWLAGEHPEQAQKILLKVISSEQRDEVMEQAVFAITQLPAEISTQMLLYLATDKTYTREVRRQALFWLANSDDDSAVEALTALLTG
jgi:HEAT repeat protein